MNKIAIDIDEVLVPFLFPMAKHRGLQLPRKEKYAYLYRDIFNIPEWESQEIVYDFYKSREFLELQPIKGSQRALLKMRRNAKKMYVVTGRQEPARERTEWWIQTHFPGIFDDVILTNSFTANEVKKVDICRSLAIDTIIDDNIHICLECIGSGMEAINFIGEDIYPWCEETEISMKGWLEMK